MAEGSKFHVLAVDDRMLIERILKTSSFQVTGVCSGSKALELLCLQENNNNEEEGMELKPESLEEMMEVNMIITDYSMPGMTGYDLLKKIKGSASLQGIPVVIMSSENIPARINKCLEEGADEFLLKPVRLSDVNKIKPHLLKTRQT